MVTKELGIVEIEGARGGVSRFVSVANRYSSELFLTCGDIRANAKSIMGMVAFAAASVGKPVTVTATGTDEEAAVESLSLLLT